MHIARRRAHLGAGPAVALALVLAACGAGGSSGHVASDRAITHRSTSTTAVATSSTLASTTTTTTSVVTTSTVARLRASGAPAHPTTTAAPASSAATGPCGRATGPVPRYQHVIWIWMENHTRDSVLGSKAAPYETSLARECGTATQYRAVGRPSLPNYIGATSGSTQGITDDGAPSEHPLAVDNLFRQVRRSGGAARTYAEAMPAPCELGSTGRYAVKHNPAAYYVGEDDRSSCGTDNLPLGTTQSGALASDIASGNLPAFAMIVPDRCNDTHDCGVDVGDSWLHTWVDRLVHSSAYADGSTAIFIVWDEPTPMPFLAVTPTVAPGSATNVALDHFALLRTTEEMLGIGDHLGAAASAPSMRPLLGI